MNDEKELMPLEPAELVKATEPHEQYLNKQGEMRDNDVITDKQIAATQKPVLAASVAVVKLKLARDAYRAKWWYKRTYKADKWKNRDKMREMRRERRETVKARKAAERAAKEAKRRERRANRAAKRDRQRIPE